MIAAVKNWDVLVLMTNTIFYFLLPSFSQDSAVSLKEVKASYQLVVLLTLHSLP